MNKSCLMKHAYQKRKKYWPLVLFAVMVFAGFYIFFSRIHPLYIHDLDDWCYVMCGRYGLPDVKQWNPARVLPEMWMPMCAYLGTYLVYPVTGDWVQSITMVFAANAALMIVIYLLMLGRVLKQEFQAEGLKLVCLLAVFLLAHLYPFLLEPKGNVHLFFANDVTCVFYYTLPALLNFSLCGYYLTRSKEKKEPITLGFLLLVVYLAIFSNLFQSIILMSLFGIQLLFALVEGVYRNGKEKKPWLSWGFIKDYVGQHYEKLLWLLVWFASLLLEVSGRRSEDVSQSLGLLDVMRTFRSTMLNMYPPFQVSVTAINLAALALAGYRFFKKKETKFLVWQLQSLFCMGLTAVYLVLVCTKTGDNYLVRPEVMLSWMVWLLMMTVSSLAYLTQKLPKVACVLPMLVFLLLFETVFHNSTYADYNVSNLPATVVKAVDDDILAQVQAANDQGLREMELYLPESMASFIWPLDTVHTPERISNAMYRHGITDRQIHITIVPSPEKDLEFNIE